jgi:hypothetical protein
MSLDIPFYRTFPVTALTRELANLSPCRERNIIFRCLNSSYMFILTVHWDLRLLWAVLTITAKLYILCLLTGATYSTYSLARIALWLGQIAKHLSSTDKTDLRVRLNEMKAKVQTSRQLHTFLFLLFGICCANEVFATLRAIQYSSMSLSAARIDVFEPVTAFAFFVFVVLLFLHVVQWAVARRLRATGVND